MPRKAIALLSGGLDSALAAKIIKDQGIEVIGLHLLSPFGCRNDVEKVANGIGIPIRFKEKGEAYLDLVQNPRYGYGKHMNPCIDCRIFMFQLADVVRQDEGADFVVTGEVLGQRPMSQQRNSMQLIDSKSEPLQGLLVRPLSAHLFEPSIPEKEGWINRDALFDISGRSRKEQFAMAEKLGIKEYEQPGGGCLLTEAAFSTKLKDWFQHTKAANTEQRLAQSQMIRLGRHFRVSDSLKIILGRDQKENAELDKYWRQSGGVHFSPDNFDGPSAVAFGELGNEETSIVGGLISKFAKLAGHSDKRIEFEKATGEKGVFEAPVPIAEERIAQWRL